MPLRLIDAQAGLKYVRPEDESDPQPTTFWYHPMTEGVARRITAKHPPAASFASQTITFNEAAIRLEAFLALVFKIENVQWPGSSESVTLTKPEEMRRFLDYSPPGALDGLYSALQVSGRLTETESKNSEGSPGSTR